MTRRVAEYAVLALALSLPLAACDDGDNMGAQTGRMSILLTDAPGDVKAAVVTIAGIYLQGQGSDTGRIFLTQTETTTNLITLANDTRTLVDGATISAGTYAQLRFILTGAFLEVENADGSTSIFASSPGYKGLPAGAKVEGELQMPSLAQSGLKVILPGGSVQVTGEQKILLVDFDVAQSFGRQAGQSRRWVMNPVLKATELQVSGSATATLRLGAGVTLPSVGGSAVTLANFKARLTSSEGSSEALALTDANADGVFEATFKFLFPGQYTLEFVAPAGVSFTTNPTTPTSVTVASAASVTSAFTVTAASGS
ncbi:MAG: DUF4382 domain-containing protein [Gemmatimonadetes bacterium]|nr:DUF4382 domain-containing protein [Gemmatimonadota bacterium]